MAWQSRLLPLMASMLVLAALFFAAVSIVELRSLYERLEHQPLDLAARLAQFERTADPNAVLGSDYLKVKVLATGDADALQRRYHQATATMLARLWTRQLGFITGMLLALVGAAFILGRLSESATKLEAESQGFKGALETSSPGIVLVVLGSALMALTIAVPFGVETRDANTYLQTLRFELPPPGTMMPVETDPPGTHQGPVSQDDVLRQERELFGQ